MQAIWMNLEIEECNFLELAKFVIPECEFPVRATLDVMCGMSQEQKQKLQTPRFHYITGEEESALSNGTWDEDKNYESTFMPYGFYFPNCSLREFGRMMGKSIKEVDDMISSFYYEDECLVFSKQMLYRAVFIILHEYGHYLTYKRLGASRKRYAQFVRDSKMKFNEYTIDLLNKSIRTEDDIKRYYVLYRECADEKEADQYALSKLEEMVQKVIEHIKKTKLKEK